MRFTQPFRGKHALAAVMLIAISALGGGDAPAPPSSKALLQRIYLGRSQLVEAASDIDGSTYLLEIELVNQRPANRPSSISISVDADEFQLPKAWFETEYGIAATTHLFGLEHGQVGFVLFCGDGERAKRRLFRIDMQKRLIKWEDWSPFGKLDAQCDYERLDLRRAKK